MSDLRVLRFVDIAFDGRGWHCNFIPVDYFAVLSEDRRCVAGREFYVVLTRSPPSFR